MFKFYHAGSQICFGLHKLAFGFCKAARVAGCLTRTEIKEELSRSFHYLEVLQKLYSMLLRLTTLFGVKPHFMT